MTIRCDHLRDHKRRELGAQTFKTVQRDTMPTEQLAHLLGAQAMWHELFQPLMRNDHRANCERKRTSESYSTRMSLMP